MGKVLALLASLLILAGCYDESITPLTPISVYYAGIYQLEYNGHEYLWNARGGIIHSESCPCWEQYETEEIDYE